MGASETHGVVVMGKREEEREKKSLSGLGEKLVVAHEI